MPEETVAYRAEEQAAQITPAYCYIVEHKADGTRSFLTNWQRDVVVHGLPARFGAADPQTFTRAQVAHGESNLNATFDAKPVNFTIWTESDEFRRYFLTAPAVNITVYIIRLSSTRLSIEGEEMWWDRDCMLLNSGVVGDVSLAGNQVTSSLTPEVFLRSSKIPRHFFQRECNHVLGGAACGVDLAAFTTHTTAFALDLAQRIITLAVAPPTTTDWFRAGVLLHENTGQRLPVLWSDAGGTGGRARLAVAFWFPQIGVGDIVHVTPGCRHVTADCVTKFANGPNYGGFPYVPNKNPAIHGI